MKLNLHCNKELEIRKEKRAANLDKTTPAETHQQADGRDTHAIGEMGLLPIARTAVAPSGTQYAACLFPALRAARLDSVAALRAE
jgi:hypothetical protein